MSRRSRTITTKGTLGLAAALTGLLAFAAPGLADNSLIQTTHPDLIAASVNGTHSVQLCFDKQLTTTFNINDQDFYLQGYTESRKTGAGGGLMVGTVVASGSGYCATVVFNGAGDVRTYSDVTVLGGAVTSTPAAGAQVNGQGSVALTGSLFPNPPGITLRPQLTSAAATSASTAVYNFNEILQNDIGANGQFGFYTFTSGDSVFHTGNVGSFTPGSSSITIAFTGAAAAALPSASRFAVNEGVVTDPLGQSNPLGAMSGPTLLLNLVSTSGLASAASTSYHFDFDNPIPAGTQVCPADFTLFDSTGVRYSPASGVPAVFSSDRKSVTLSFLPVSPGGDPNQITLATVAPNALDSTSCSTSTHPLSSHGAVALAGATDRAGLTTGPDLIGFHLDKSNGNVLFDFDAPVSTSAINPAAFHVIDGGGTVSSAPDQGGTGLLGAPPSGQQFTVNPTAPNEVVVNFSAPQSLLGLLSLGSSLALVNSAVGVTVDEGAVADSATGQLNPIGTLGVAQPAPATPAGPTIPPAPPVPPLPPLVLPKTPAKKTGCVTHKVITLHLLKSVSARLKSATATLNGKSYPVSKKLVISISLSKYVKVKTLTLKIKGKPKTGHLAISATRTYHPCG
jgi:hypothetical protein